MGENEEAGEAGGGGGIREEEARAEGEIGATVFGGERLGREERGGIVFAEEKIGGVEKERGFDVEGWAAESHYSESERVIGLCSAACSAHFGFFHGGFPVT